jgi:type VI secretion system protein ImpJ
LSRLEINEKALDGEQFEIAALSLLLPEGDWIDFPGNATLAPRPFRAAWQNPEAPLPIFLGVAPFRTEGNNVFQTDDPESAPDGYRFTTPLTPDLVADFHGSGPKADVRTLRYRLRLCFGDEMRNAILRIPVARLILDGERVRLDHAILPPLLDIHAAPALANLLRDVRDVLLSRARQLEEFKMVGGEIAKGQNSATSLYAVTLFSILGVISRNVPELDQLLAAPRAHPWFAFLLLARLVGEISIFSPTLTPLGETPQGERAVPPYDHAHPYECFAAAASVITRLVDSLVVGPDFSLTLEARDGLWHTLIPRSARNNSYSYWLLLRSQTEALASKAAAFGKLAPSKKLPDIVARALPGIRLAHADAPPVGLPRRKDTAYLQIDQSDPLWEKTLQDGEISFFLPDAPPDLWAQLTIIRK